MSKFESRPPAPPGAGGGDPLEQLFEQARGERLGAQEMSALWERVSAASLGAPSPHGGGGAAAGGAPAGAGVGGVGAGVGVKTLAALLVGGGIVAAAGGAHLWQSSRHPVPAPVGVAAPARASLPVPVVAPSDVEPPAASPREVEVSSLPGVPGRVRIGPKARSTVIAEGRDTVRTPELQRAWEPEPVRPTAAAAESAAISNASNTSTPSAPSFATSSQRSQQDRAAATPTSLDAAPSEAALLLRARRALASDPAAALALTDEHARRFPAGTLVPEREVLAIEALARLGRSSEARQRLDALRQRFPNSANVSRLDELIGR